jgi:hypothetical protein
MRAARRLVCLLPLLAVAGALALTPSRAAAQTAASSQHTPTRSADAVRKRTPPAIDHSATLLQMEAVLGRIAVSRELVPGDAQELTRLMAAARGRTIPESALSALSIRLALAMADGTFDDDGLERLAQDLFAALNSRELSPREAMLLVTDVSTLLRDSGAESGAIDAATLALAAIAPTGADTLDTPSPRSGGLLVLRREPRPR